MDRGATRLKSILDARRSRQITSEYSRRSTRSQEEEEGKRMLVLPAGKYNTMLQVRAIDGAISR